MQAQNNAAGTMLEKDTVMLDVDIVINEANMYNSECQSALGNSCNDPVFMAKFVFYINNFNQQAMIDCCQCYGYDGSALEYLRTEAFRLLYDWVKSKGNSTLRKQHNPQMENAAQTAARDFIKCWVQHHLGVFAARIDAERRAAELEQLCSDAGPELELLDAPNIKAKKVKHNTPVHKIVKTSEKKHASEILDRMKTGLKRLTHRSSPSSVPARARQESDGLLKHIERRMGNWKRNGKKVMVPSRSSKLLSKAEHALSCSSLESVIDPTPILEFAHRRRDSAISLGSAISITTGTTSSPVVQQLQPRPSNQSTATPSTALSSANHMPATVTSATLSASIALLNLSATAHLPSFSAQPVGPPSQTPAPSTSTMPAPPAAPMPSALPAPGVPSGSSTLLGSLSSLSLNATPAQPSSSVPSAVPKTTALDIKILLSQPISCKFSHAAKVFTMGRPKSAPQAMSTSSSNAGQVSTATQTTSMDESNSSSTDENSSVSSPAGNLPEPAIDSAANTSMTVGAIPDSLTFEDSAINAGSNDATAGMDEGYKESSIVVSQTPAFHSPTASTSTASTTASTNVAPTLSSAAPAPAASAPASSSTSVAAPVGNDATTSSIYADLSFEASSDPAVNDRNIADMSANMTKRKKNTPKYKAGKEKKKKENKQKKVEKEMMKSMNKLGIGSSSSRLREADKRRKCNQRR